MILIEKAFAKFCGSFAALDGGHELWAFEALTGDPVFALNRDRASGKWVRHDLARRRPLLTPTLASPITFAPGRRAHEGTNDGGHFLIYPVGAPCLCGERAQDRAAQGSARGPRREAHLLLAAYLHPGARLLATSSNLTYFITTCCVPTSGCAAARDLL